MAVSKPRTIEKLEKPRPLRISDPQRINLTPESECPEFIKSINDIVSLINNVATQLNNKFYNQSLQSNIITMCNYLKLHYHKLETTHKDQLDKALIAIKNGSQDQRLDMTTRVQLLELIRFINCETHYSEKLPNLDCPNKPSSTEKPEEKPVESVEVENIDLEEFKYTVFIGKEYLKITGTNLNLVWDAKQVLDNHFADGKVKGEDNEAAQSNYFKRSDDNSILKSVRHVKEPHYQPNNKNDTKEMSYNFLIQCSKGPFAKRPPVDWKRIQKEFPMIVRDSPENLNSVTNDVIDKHQPHCFTDNVENNLFKSSNAVINKHQPYFFKDNVDDNSFKSNYNVINKHQPHFFKDNVDDNLFKSNYNVINKHQPHFFKDDVDDNSYKSNYDVINKHQPHLFKENVDDNLFESNNNNIINKHQPHFIKHNVDDNSFKLKNNIINKHQPHLIKHNVDDNLFRSSNNVISHQKFDFNYTNVNYNSHQMYDQKLSHDSYGRKKLNIDIDKFMRFCQ